ncbi:MAG: hypothetical protein JWM59_5090 [Verrucomicrobiales bacterium]|nr:hypothetical protein [Verrucomicrobiales bacterium]
MELQTRQRTVHPGLSCMDACADCMEPLLTGGVDGIAEGTALPVRGYGTVSGNSARPAVTLVVETVEAAKEDETEASGSPGSPGGRPGFGFPTL